MSNIIWKDIHFKLEDSWFERWQGCSRYRGQRSVLLQRLVKKLILVLEKQKDSVEEIDISLKVNGE